MKTSGYTLIVIAAVASLNVIGQNADHLTDIMDHRKKIHHEFLDPEESPLTENDRAHFKELQYFEIDGKYNVDCIFKRTPKEKVFKMKTSGTRKPEYVKYGELFFKLDGKDLRLSVFQNIKLTQQEEYKDYLFVPFKDLTNGSETYGGGRYIDMKIPETKELKLDFNKAYNPYCAYSDGYSCPIPPSENYLDVMIPAGVKKYKDEH